MDAFTDFEKTVDEDMKKNWDEAKRRKETTAALIAVNDLLLHDAKQVTSWIMGDLVQLVGQYARLSLAGSYLAQLRSKISFLEGRERRLADRTKVKLGHMKRELELLNKVEEDAQKGVSG